MTHAIERFLVAPGASIRDVFTCIDGNESGIALIVDGERRLLGTVTDGDVRRAMLADADLDAPALRLLDVQLELGHTGPITAPVGTAPAELLVLMERSSVRQVPLLDDDQRVVGVSVIDDLVLGPVAPLRAVVMAGGFGTRLGELTERTPKPMLPVGDRPLLERIIDQLREAGIRHVNLATHYRAEAIESHFGDGRDFGVDIEYVAEKQPLGTAGALGLLEAAEPVLVINGDILTGIDFRAMHRFHLEHRADMTVAVRPYEVKVPYGLVELEDADVTGISEKPLVRGFVNAGIYLIGTEARSLVRPGEQLDMTHLIERLIANERCVVGFPLREYWLDIGQLTDYEQALVDVESL
jgi:dTDP-glucose pyrophosphorylase/CBS domain-containing protein